MDDTEGQGTHWVVVYNVGNLCIYFDSFGVDPPEEVLGRMRKTNKKMVMNTFRIQDLKSIKCGFFCMYLIDELLKGGEYIDVLVYFNPTDYKANEHLV